MATNYDPNMDKENQDNNSQNNGQSNSTSNANSGTTSAMPDNTAPKQVSNGQSGSVDAGQGTTAKPTNSGQFTNLQNYFNANQPTNSGQTMGSKVSNKLNQQGQNLSQGVTQASSDFTNQANTNRNQYDENLTQTVTADPNAFYQKTQTDPSSTDVNKFNQEQSGTYSGPTQLNNYDQLSANAQNYQNLTNQTGSESGRFNLLKTFFNNGSYNAGQQNLDNLLMQGDKNQMQQLGQTRVQAANVNNNLQQAQAQAQDVGSQYQQEAKDAANKLNTALTGSMSDISTQNAAAVAAAKAEADRVQQELASKQMTAADAAKLGITAGTTYGVDASKYYNPVNINANTVATQDQYNKYDALAHLAKSTDTLFTDPTQIGANANANPFDLKNYQSQVDSAKRDYTTALTPIQNQLTWAQNAAGFKTQEQLNDYIKYMDATGQGNAGLDSHYQDLSSYMPQISSGADAFNSVMGNASNNFTNNLDYANQINLSGAVQGIAAQQAKQLQDLQQAQAFYKQTHPFDNPAMAPSFSLNTPTVRDMSGDIGGYASQAAAQRAALQALQSKYNINSGFTIT